MITTWIDISVIGSAYTEEMELETGRIRHRPRWPGLPGEEEWPHEEWRAGHAPRIE